MLEFHIVQNSCILRLDLLKTKLIPIICFYFFFPHIICFAMSMYRLTTAQTLLAYVVFSFALLLLDKPFVSRFHAYVVYHLRILDKCFEALFHCQILRLAEE